MSVVTSKSTRNVPDLDARGDGQVARPSSKHTVETTFFVDIPIAVLLFRKGSVAFTNEMALHLFGADKSDQLVGLPAERLMSHHAVEPSDLGLTVEGHTIRELREIRVRGQRVDGGGFDAVVTFSPIRLRGIAACAAYFRPVRALPARSAEVELERIAIGHEASGNGIWDWRVDTGEFYMSPGFKALLGFEDVDLPNTYPAWLRLIHRGDDGLHDRRMRAVLEGCAETCESEIRVRTKHGEERCLRLRGMAVRENGVVRRIVGVANDITDRKATELERAEALARALDTQAQLADAMNLAGQGFTLFNAEDRLVLFNDRFQNSFPQVAKSVHPDARFEELLNAMLDANVIAEVVGNRQEWLRDRMHQHKNPVGPFVTQTTDGRYLQITEQRTAERGTVVIRTDITPLKETEAALQTRVAQLESAKSMLEKQSTQLHEFTYRLAEAKDEADAANRTKSEFLVNMSHELRTPLNAIMGFSEVIKNELFGPASVRQYVDYAGDIYTSGALLLEIINDILDPSKVEAGKLELAEEEIFVKEVADAVFRLVRGRAEDHGVDLVQNIDQELPRLYADKLKLKQMLLNLLSNAVKFTPKGGTVALAAELDDDGGLSLCVRDTGIGIVPELFDLVLSPFGQIDSALARQHQGTGLGLPLVKALVGLHGGEIELTSDVGEGTTVTLHFPPQRVRR